MKKTTSKKITRQGSKADSKNSLIRKDQIYNAVPNQVNDSEILCYLSSNTIDWKYLEEFKKLTGFTENQMAEYLNVSVRSLQTYRQGIYRLSRDVQEHLLSLLSLIKHGNATFGSVVEFAGWLNQDNFYFDGKAPSRLLNSPAGIRFIDSRLTAMDYGDNV